MCSVPVTLLTARHTCCAGNLTEEKSPCVERELRYGDSGSCRVLKMYAWYIEGLRARQPRNRGSILDMSRTDVHSVQTGSGAHPASHPMDTGGSFPGG
jgi:hypothetical protein